MDEKTKKIVEKAKESVEQRKKKVTLDEQDAKLVMQFIDHGIKAGGLKVAEIGVSIAKKITKQLSDK